MWLALSRVSTRRSPWSSHNAVRAARPGAQTWEETKPELLSNIQADLGGLREAVVRRVVPASSSLMNMALAPWWGFFDAIKMAVSLG